MLDNPLTSDDLQWFDLFLERTCPRTDLPEHFFLIILDGRRASTYLIKVEQGGL